MSHPANETPATPARQETLRVAVSLLLGGLALACGALALLSISSGWAFAGFPHSEEAEHPCLLHALLWDYSAQACWNGAGVLLVALGAAALSARNRHANWRRLSLAATLLAAGCAGALLILARAIANDASTLWGC